MVRNWQNRVEIVTARRFESKQRKQKVGDKRQYKAWSQEFLEALDRNRDHFSTRDNKVWKLHIWTDTLAADKQQQLLDIDNPEDGRKKRSISIGNELEKGRKGKGRGRSNSNADSAPSKKKAHPRSKEGVHEESKEEKQQAWMCRSFFFTGKCSELSSKGSGRNKTGGCRYIHSSNDEIPICRQLSKSEKKAHLEQSEAAVEESMTSSVDAANHLGAMEMTFSMEIVMDLESKEDISTQVTALLSSKNLKLSSIVYGVLNDALVFDRYCGGKLHESDEELLAALLLVDAAASSNKTGEESALLHLPGIVLEHILTFLPDAAVPSATRVCRAWYHEIGKNSPNLWKHMLDRRAWSHPSIDDSASEYHGYREQFLQHYSVLRDLKAIQAGLGAITDPRKHEETETEMTYQDFSARRDAPTDSAICVGLEVWSPRRLLGAYDADCSLRLFETLPKPGRDGELVCREQICQIFDPYRNTKKRYSRIVALGLDKECVASLCEVSTTNISTTAFVLVVMSRDDFLTGNSAGAFDSVVTPDGMTNLNAIDVGESVLNYLLSSDVGDHRLLQLIDFVSQDGDIEKVEVRVSRTMAACGYGRFMVEASISIPTTDDDASRMLMVDRKLFLVSASIGSIVWMGESNPLSHELRPREEDMILSYLRRPSEVGGSGAACYISASSATSPAILVGEIGAYGDFPSVQLLESSLLVRNEILNNGWEIFNRGRRAMLITPSDVVAADVLIRSMGGIIRERKSVISFYPRYSTSDTASYATMTIPGNVEVFRMSCTRDDHIILACHGYPATTTTTPDPREDDVLDDIDGHWFGGEDEVANAQADDFAAPPGRLPKAVAIIVHVPGKCEIGRVPLYDNRDVHPAIPRFVVDSHDTVGCGLVGKGIVMSGQEVRSVAQEITSHTSSQRVQKSKKQQKNNGVKKNQHARGRTKVCHK